MSGGCKDAAGVKGWVMWREAEGNLQQDIWATLITYIESVSKLLVVFNFINI